jgi:predicted ATPase
MNLLTQLVEKSLVEIDARGERYRLLETVRQYALELLKASGEIYEVQMRHALYFVAFVDRTKRESAGPRPALWLAQLDVDLENLLAAQAACDHLQGGRSWDCG